MRLVVPVLLATAYALPAVAQSGAPLSLGLVRPPHPVSQRGPHTTYELERR